MSVRAATARSSATKSGSSTVPERTPTIVGPSLDLWAFLESANVRALGAAGLVGDASAEVQPTFPDERTEGESARMFLYAPCCAATCDR